MLAIAVAWLSRNEYVLEESTQTNNAIADRQASSYSANSIAKTPNKDSLQTREQYERMVNEQSLRLAPSERAIRNEYQLKKVYDLVRGSNIPDDLAIVWYILSSCYSIDANDNSNPAVIAKKILTFERNMSPTATARPERIQAFRRDQERCLGFLHGELAIEKKQLETKQAQYDKSKVKQTERLLAELNKTSLKEDSLSQVLEQIAPQENILALLSTTRFLTAQSGALLLDGEPVSLADNPAYAHALSSLPCRFGTLCNSDNKLVLNACWESGECGHDNYFEVLQRVALSPREWEQFITYSNILYDIFNRGQYHRLRLDPTRVIDFTKTP